MTSQEKELLTRFLQQLAAAQAAQKDVEAEGLIREASARQPDAAYLLVQRAIQLEQLLQASQTENRRLAAELDQARSGSRGGFLNDTYAWGSRTPSPAADTEPPAQRAPAPAPAAPAAPARAGLWGSGLFGNIASTAAGVVAGSFLFQGIQGLMHRDPHSSADSLHHDRLDQAQADEPQLLNSFDTPQTDADDRFVADVDDSSDFA